MEIEASRELAFFPGTAVGPRYPGYEYSDNSGERVVSVSRPDQGKKRRVYFNGGCYFSPAKSEGLKCAGTTLWEYVGPSDMAPAVVGCCVGQGRVVLSGVHPEVGHEDLGSSSHSEDVIREMELRDSDRLEVLEDMFVFLESVTVHGS